MNKYELRVIKYQQRPVSAEEYEKAWNEATTIICNGLKEVWNECGGKLHRERHCYAGTDGIYEFIAKRIG